MLKKILLIALLFSFNPTSGFSLPCYAQDNQGGDTLVVMTFNVLCSWCDIGNWDRWQDRIHYSTDIFQRHDPDLIGLQELMNAQEVNQLLELNPEYSELYFEDNSGIVPKNLCDSVIFYRTDRFEVIEYGFYWLSETPDIPWTFGWDAFQLWRIVAWAHLRQIEDGKELYFASTHFDPNSPNQEMSAPLVLERTATWADNYPAIVVGDFNTRPGATAYDILTNGVGGEGFHLVDTYDISDTWHIDTNQSPPPDYDPMNKIDHIFLGGEAVDWQVPRWVVDMYIYGDQNRYPSDHFAIVSELHLSNWNTPIPTATPTVTHTPTSTRTPTGTATPTCTFIPTNTPTPTPGFAPARIILAGYMGTNLSMIAEGFLHILAVTSSDQFDPAETVGVYYQGQPTELILIRNSANDSLFEMGNKAEFLPSQTLILSCWSYWQKHGVGL